MIPNTSDLRGHCPTLPRPAALAGGAVGGRDVSRSSWRSRRRRELLDGSHGALETLAPGPPAGVLNSGHYSVCRVLAVSLAFFLYTVGCHDPSNETKRERECV
jgi:hypothetical protein